ncbi:hypothetical protein BRADI_1g48041v3 [Brachypodium distachyon]|uniref:Uncharacterized protein n=1 Tax=Brachypodium distachyon TaxID=15368 RepID=A0A0Q3NP69_BRADI|nr:hypothetical protein BRADI_1g48041v3 [Brachypodium distachyon]
MARGKSSHEGTRKQHGRCSAQPSGSARPPPTQPSTGCAAPPPPLQFTGCAPPRPPLQFTGAVAPPSLQHLGAVAPQYTPAPSPSPQYTAAPNPPPSDPEVIADALLKYEADYGEPFKLCHWWEVLKNEPKWLTYCERLKKDKNSSPPSIVIDVVQDIPRPEGSKAAKANRNGKRKMPEMADEMRDELDKFIAAQTAAREDHEGMKEFQLRISSEKLEAAKLAQQAEKDKKERKILDTYKELMMADTSGLDEDEKTERKKALKFMSLQLFGGEN